jgi:hypothetical protein
LFEISKEYVNELSKKLKSLWTQLGFWLNPVKTVFDILIIIVVVLSLSTAQESTKAAHEANQLSKEAISSGYTPWVKLVDFSMENGNDTLVLNYTLKNFSTTGLALNLQIQSLMPKLAYEEFSFTYEVLMPGEEGTLTLHIPLQGNTELLNSIDTGVQPIRISVSYTDRFSTPFRIEQEIRKIGKLFRMTEYAIKKPTHRK